MTDLSTIDTTIYVGFVPVHQPVTVFTNVIIAGLCLYFYLRLKKIQTDNLSTKYWQLFFLFMVFSTLSGSSSHAFFAIHEGFAYKAFWLTMHVLNGVSVYYAQQATLHSVLQYSKFRNYWKWAYDLQFLFFIPAVFIFQNFLVVVIDLAIGLIPIMVLHFAVAKKESANGWIAYGILVSFLTAFVHLSKFSLHVYFNHLDIAHVFIMINLSMMYIGIKQKAVISSVAAA